jgi:hypothetical protein
MRATSNGEVLYSNEESSDSQTGGNNNMDILADDNMEVTEQNEQHDCGDEHDQLLFRRQQQVLAAMRSESYQQIIPHPLHSSNVNDNTSSNQMMQPASHHIDDIHFHPLEMSVDYYLSQEFMDEEELHDRLGFAVDEGIGPNDATTTTTSDTVLLRDSQPTPGCDMDDIDLHNSWHNFADTL